MICVYCGGQLKRKAERCPECGRNVRMIKKLIATSNALYNEGLRRATIRDLSGASEVLRTSPKLYKLNIPARNLLGLVYFEMGEGVRAMAEWVISKNFLPEDNPAGRYLDTIQNSPAQLEVIGQTTKKYNQALLYCQQDSHDLAVIQLKKVLSVNPKMIRAHQLLALLYLQEQRYDLAKKTLRNALKLDGSNLTTLRYLKECNLALKKEPNRKKKEKQEEQFISYMSGNETIIRPTKFRDNTAIMTIVNILIGLAIGVLITWFLVVPGVRMAVRNEMNVQVSEANETIADKEQTILSLQNQVDQMQSQIDAAKLGEEESDTRLTSYQQLLNAYIAYTNEDVNAAGQALSSVNEDYLDTAARDAYETINNQVNEEYMDAAYRAGDAAYNAKNYDEAIQEFLKIMALDETYHSGDALYSLAQAYSKNGDDQNAATYYRKIVTLYPDTQRARTAERFLQEYGENADAQQEETTDDARETTPAAAPQTTTPAVTDPAAAVAPMVIPDPAALAVPVE